MANPEIPILDVWPLHRIDESIARAYRKLMDRGVIRLRSPIRVSKKSDLAVFDYLSAMDREQTHRELKRMAETKED